MNITSETTFETAIIESLINKSGGYIQGNPKDYSSELGMFKAEVLEFLQTTQPKQWKKLANTHGDSIGDRLIQRLFKEMDLRGSLDVIRNGITDYGVRFQLAYFKPESGLNPETLKLYQQNRFTVTRQVHYSQKNPRQSIDLVLSLNGLPVATIELKNQFTGQNTNDAKKQYNTTRDNKELLFTFKKLVLVHFIDKLNEKFGTEFDEADRLFFEQIEMELINDKNLKTQAKVNKLDTFKYAFQKTFIDKLIARMEQNQEICEKNTRK